MKTYKTPQSVIDILLNSIHSKDESRKITHVWPLYQKDSYCVRVENFNPYAPKEEDYLMEIKNDKIYNFYNI